MKRLKNFAKNFWKDQGGQGTAEYVLLLAIVVGALVMFGGPLKQKIMDKWNSVASDMDQIK